MVRRLRKNPLTTLLLAKRRSSRFQLYWRRTLVHFTFIQRFMQAFLLIAILLTVLYVLLIIYYRFAFTAVPSYQITNSQFPTTNISIIIPARNEEHNIENCLQSISQNTYPTDLFEIIVVDDHSKDGTAAVVKKYASQNVKLISLSDHISTKINSYKKKAIEIAVAQATGTLIITTDADCIVPTKWLQTIAAFYEEKNPAFIAAPVAIDCGWSFIQIFQSLDFMTLQGITAAVVNKKQMTMCNGANMAYERAAFYEVGGFAGIDIIAAGNVINPCKASYFIKSSPFIRHVCTIAHGHLFFIYYSRSYSL